MSRKIYRVNLDHTATTDDKTHPYISRDVPYLGVWEGNSHSIHDMGVRAHIDIRQAEEKILRYINGHAGELLWTGSGSQANSLAIQSICSESDHLVSSAIEHKSILQHQDEFFSVSPNRYGLVDPADLVTITDGMHRMVSLQLVNNETGVYQPVGRLRHAYQNQDILIHTDAVQALGKVSVDVEELGVDLMTISAHKINGPKGIGALWVRNTVRDQYKFPYLGTLSGELIYRFAHAVEQLDVQAHQDQVAVLEANFLGELDNTGVDVDITVRYLRVVGILSLHFPGVDNDDLVFALSDKGIYISSGSACNEGEVKPSHVLTAMGISKEQANSTVRISIGKDNTVEEMLYAASIIGTTAKELRYGS